MQEARQVGMEVGIGMGSKTGTCESPVHVVKTVTLRWGGLCDLRDSRVCTPSISSSRQLRIVSFLINLLHNNIIIIIINNNIRNIDLCGVYHNVRVRRPQDWSRGKSPGWNSIQKEG